jgi:GAF domain-containing protein
MVPLEPDHVTAADTFARLAVDMHAAGGVEETVETIVQFALQALNCSFAGIALSTRSGPEIPAVTDPVVAEVYRFQLESQDGPLMAAIQGRTTVLVRDTDTDGRWPEWAAKVADLGVRSVLDVPLIAGDPSAPTVGALGLYSKARDGFDAEDEAVARILAQHASVAVAAKREIESLSTAVDARKLVGQALGILMERYSLDEERAFAVLKRYSQTSHRKLRDVAQELIGTRKLPN